jgi:hypothetical protein
MSKQTRMWQPLLMAGLIGLAAAAPAQAQTRSIGATVRVSVVDGAVRVSTDGVTLPAGASSITWQMTSPGWRFADGSIDFGDATGAFSCRVFSDGAAISCNRSSSAPQGQLPYRIRVSNGGPLVQPPQPHIYISLD